MAINTQAAHGSVPQHRQPVEAPGWKALFHSEREIALKMDKMVKPGYGVLRAGTVMSLVFGSDKLFPYPGTDADAIVTPRAFALADVANTSAIINVTMEDSYKFQVGDELMVASSAAVHDGGAIVTIDRTTAPNYAIITFTDDTVVATLTVANGANCYLKSIAGTDGVKADYILDKDIDTGSGEGALGGQTSIVVSNAILNYGSLVGIDADAITDLGAINDNDRFLILK